ncbi:hypothetical protein RDWZM_006307, partial [Blomia tropicalis]
MDTLMGIEWEMVQPEQQQNVNHIVVIIIKAEHDNHFASKCIVPNSLLQLVSTLLIVKRVRSSNKCCTHKWPL